MLLAAGALVAGCGGGEEAPASQDRRIESELDRYLERNHAEAPWYRSVEDVRASRRVVTVTTELRVRGRDRRAAREICQAIQGSDVADFTRGHGVVGAGGERFPCPERRK